MMVPRPLAEVKAVVARGRTSPEWEIRESGYFLFLSYGQRSIADLDFEAVEMAARRQALRLAARALE